MIGRPARRTPLAVAAALACAACASVEAPPPGPSPFRAVRKVVLVRRVDDPKAPRARDPIDALKESLDARGYETQVVKVGPGKGGELRDLERLEDRVGERLSREPAAGRVVSLGAEAGSVVAKLGADAIAGCHRYEPGLLAPPIGADPFQGPQAPYRPPAPVVPARRPAGALSLVAADGSAAGFPWGGGGASVDGGALLNPAEAIDALLSALSGNAGELTP